MKDNKSNGYTQYNLLRNNGDVFNYTLASVDLIGKSLMNIILLLVMDIKQ